MGGVTVKLVETVSMRVLDLFSGIGGFSLGLERAGMRTVAFCEIEPYCRAVLSKHWPGVPCYGDIRELTANRLAADGIAIDVICGGFPCQDLSFAGKGAGLAGKRSGLWREYSRLISELRPGYVIVENVSALLNRGLGQVLGDLATIGYDAEWHCIPASYVGAPHRRDRIWIVAYPNCSECKTRQSESFRNGSHKKGDSGAALNGISLANTTSIEGNDTRKDGQARLRFKTGGCRGECGATQWSSEPDVGRVAHGISSRVDRLRALGNSVVPQIPEIIGRAILSANTSGDEHG